MTIRPEPDREGKSRDERWHRAIAESMTKVRSLQVDQGSRAVSFLSRRMGSTGSQDGAGSSKPQFGRFGLERNITI